MATPRELLIKSARTMAARQEQANNELRAAIDNNVDAFIAAEVLIELRSLLTYSEFFAEKLSQVGTDQYTYDNNKVLRAFDDILDHVN